MADVFVVLGEDHQRVLQILDALTASTTLAAAKGELVSQLVISESRHEAVEEMYFWPIVKERVENGSILADRAIEQEQGGKEALEALEKSEGSQRDRLIHGFAAAAREHIAYEQDEVWPRLRRVLSAKEAEELGSQLEEAKETAPTRPHSHTPPTPGMLKTAGPATAAMDKVRDAVTGRG